MSDASVPPHDKGDKGEEPPVQESPISRSSGVQSEEAVKGEREPTESEAGTEPESPHGVGESVSGRGEKKAKGKEAEGVKGASKRPYGTRARASDSGVGGSEPIDEESPSMPPGDQAG
jgi:hypothetical protein